MPHISLTYPTYLLVRMTFFSGELMFVPSDHSYQFYIVMFFIEYWNYICSTSYVLERFHSVTHQRLLKLPDYLIQYQ